VRLSDSTSKFLESKRRNSLAKPAQVPEHGEFTHSGSLVAAGHLSPATLSRHGSDRREPLRNLQEGSVTASVTLSAVVSSLHVEYEEHKTNYGILFIFSLFCEYVNLEYVRVRVIYRVNQAEYVVHFLGLTLGLTCITGIREYVFNT